VRIIKLACWGLFIRCLGGALPPVVRCSLRGDVKPLIDYRGDGFYLGAQLLFDLVQVKAVFIGDEVDGQSQMTKASSTTDAVEIGLRVLWEVKIDDNIHRLYINPPSKQVCTHKVSASTIPKIVENSIPVRLQHLSVDVEA